MDTKLRFRLEPSPLWLAFALALFQRPYDLCLWYCREHKKIKTHLPAMDFYPVYSITLDLVFAFHLIPALSANSPPPFLSTPPPIEMVALTIHLSDLPPRHAFSPGFMFLNFYFSLFH